MCAQPDSTTSGVGIREQQQNANVLRNDREIWGRAIPKMTRGEVMAIFGISENDPGYKGQGKNVWCAPLVSPVIKSLYIETDEKIKIFGTALNRSVKDAFGKDKWYEALSHLPSEISGQEKNFLVACRTYIGGPRASIRVLIRGSKAGAYSGDWVYYYGLYLSCYSPNVEMDLFDVHEYDYDQIHQIPDQNGEERVISIRHISEYTELDEGVMRTYDVIVDDAFDTKEMAPLNYDPQTLWYSKKDQSGSVAPFMHRTEGRVFSHQLEQRPGSPCPCVRCRLIHDLSPTAGMHSFLWSVLVQLKGSPCNYMATTSDLHVRGQTQAQLLAGAVISMTTPAVQRAVLSLLYQLPLEAVHPLQVQMTMGPEHLRTSDWTHGYGFRCLTQDARIVDTTSFLREQRVRLCGIDPILLQGVKVKHSAELDAHALCATRDHARIMMGHRFLWYPDSRALPGYKAIGQIFRGLHGYEMERLDQEVLEVSYSLWEGFETKEPEIYATIPGKYKTKIDSDGVLGPTREGRRKRRNEDYGIFLVFQSQRIESQILREKGVFLLFEGMDFSPGMNLNLHPTMIIPFNVDVSVFNIEKTDYECAIVSKGNRKPCCMQREGEGRMKLNCCCNGDHVVKVGDEVFIPMKFIRLLKKC